MEIVQHGLSDTGKQDTVKQTNKVHSICSVVWVTFADSIIIIDIYFIIFIFYVFSNVTVVKLDSLFVIF